MSNYEKIEAYLQAHPTPWRFIREASADVLLDPRSIQELSKDGYHQVRATDGEERDVVEDFNGNVVFSSWDRDAWYSHIEGDVRALVDFVNLVGTELEALDVFDGTGWEETDLDALEALTQDAEPDEPEDTKPEFPYPGMATITLHLLPPLHEQWQAFTRGFESPEEALEHLLDHGSEA